MGICVSSKNKQSQQSHKEIEFNLKQDDRFNKRVFITGDHNAVSSIICSIDGNNQSLYEIQNKLQYLISGYIQIQYQSQINIPFIPSDLQLLLAQFYGNYNPLGQHYEFHPNIQQKSTINTQNQLPSLLIPNPIINSNYSNNSCMDSLISMENNSNLLITYHSFQCFKPNSFKNLRNKKNKKKINNYYGRWIHLIDNSLSIVFVTDLSKIHLLLKDMEKFRRLTIYSNGKYCSKMPMLVLSGIHSFYSKLSKAKYKEIFIKQFEEFNFNKNDLNVGYNESALKFIKDQYLNIFNYNLKNGFIHWSKKNKSSPNLYIRTIDDLNDISEIQNVWTKLNKTLLHGNLLHELRIGGIAK